MEKNEELKTSEYLRGIVLNLPDSPGIYQYLNSEGTIIMLARPRTSKDEYTLILQKSISRQRQES